MRRLILTCLSALLFCAAVSGTFVPFRDSTGLQYLFVWSGWPTILFDAGMTSGALLVAYAVVRVVAVRWVPAAAPSALSAAWLWPLAPLGLVALGILPAAPHVGDHAAPLAYWLYDLRWWWVALALGAALWRLDQALGHPVRRRASAISQWPADGRLLLGDALLFVTIVSWVVITTPGLRFSGGLEGDEPKYVRYCEVWYQGGGFDISGKKLMSDAAIDLSPSLAGVAALPYTVVDESRNLARDLKAFVASPTSFRWNRGVKDENGFFTGKDGGTYELHQPGLSLILFPGYFLDRYLLGLEAGYQGEVPADLVMTNVMMLVTYALAAVALFRLLRHALGSDVWAWLWAALGMASLPVSAFAFQFYPEVPAALIVLVAINIVWFHARTASRSLAATAGAAIGALAWLHPRFLPLSAVLAGFGVLRLKKGGRLAFGGAVALVWLSVSAYDYHLTGSWSPTAAYSLYADEVQFSVRDLPIAVTAYFFDGTWGLLAHAPWLFGLVPGLVWFGRRSIGATCAVVLPSATLLLTAASHSLTAAGSTPDRFVTAICPLLVWPVAGLVRWAWESRVVRTMTTIAVVVTLDTALAYNWSHEKGVGPLHDGSLSGWKINLALPSLRSPIWPDSWPNFVLFLAVLGLLVVASAWVWVRVRRGDEPSRCTARPGLIAALTAMGTVALTSAATAANETWSRGVYLMSPARAEEVAATALVAAGNCQVCFSTRDRQINWTKLPPDAATGMHLDLSTARQIATVHVVLDARADPEHRIDGPRFGRVSIDFGDGTQPTWFGVVGDRSFTHAYTHSGTFVVIAFVDLPGGRHVVRNAIQVGDAGASRPGSSH